MICQCPRFGRCLISLRISAFLCASCGKQVVRAHLPQRRRGTQRYAEKKFELNTTQLRAACSGGALACRCDRLTTCWLHGTAHAALDRLIKAQCRLPVRRLESLLPPDHDRTRNCDRGVRSKDHADQERQRETPKYLAAKKHH